MVLVFILSAGGWGAFTGHKGMKITVAADARAAQNAGTRSPAQGGGGLTKEKRTQHPHFQADPFVQSSFNTGPRPEVAPAHNSLRGR